jgi:hypothetical protein
MLRLVDGFAAETSTRSFAIKLNLYLPEPLDSSVMIAIGSTETCDQEMGMSGGGWVPNADQTPRWTAMSSIPSPSSRRGWLGLTHRTRGRKQLGRKQLDERSFRREYFSTRGCQEQTFARWAINLAVAVREGHVTPSERRNSLMARHAVCSAAAGLKDLVEIANPGLKPSPFQVRSATVQHGWHGGVNGRGKGRGQGL